MAILYILYGIIFCVCPLLIFGIVKDIVDFSEEWKHSKEDEYELKLREEKRQKRDKE